MEFLPYELMDYILSFSFSLKHEENLNLRLVCLTFNYSILRIAKERRREILIPKAQAKYPNLKLSRN